MIMTMKTRTFTSADLRRDDLLVEAPEHAAEAGQGRPDHEHGDEQAPIR